MLPLTAVVPLLYSVCERASERVCLRMYSDRMTLRLMVPVSYHIYCIFLCLCCLVIVFAISCYFYSLSTIVCLSFLACFEQEKMSPAQIQRVDNRKVERINCIKQKWKRSTPMKSTREWMKMRKKEEEGRHTDTEGEKFNSFTSNCVLLKWDFRNSVIRYVWLIWFDCDFFSCSSSIINQIVLPWMAIVSVQRSTIQPTDQPTEQNHFQIT